MASKEPPKETLPPTKERIEDRNISKEMRESYLDYAMSVITSRALPDVRDGLKPVHRRILFAMHEMGLTASAKFRKSAAVVGEVLGKYHPHGDTSVYDAMVKMAQEFSFRYPLVLGQGNFGCFTKDTKVKLADGRNPSFEELIKEDTQGKTNYTYTVNSAGLISVAKIEKPRITKKNAELVRVVLDNEVEIRCTPDHLFMLRDGSYKEAQQLIPEDSLMPLYEKFSEKTDRLNRKGYILIFQNKTSEWVPAHHLADNYNLTQGIYKKSDGRVRHHVDFNKLNNSPENIRRLHWGEHWKVHYEQASEQHKSASYREAIAEGRRKYWSNTLNREKRSALISERNKKSWQDAVYREKMRKMLSEVNIRYIEEHPEKRKEYSVRATVTLKKLWQDPRYKALFHEKIVQSNKNRITNNTGRLKFLNICTKAIKERPVLNEYQYELARNEMYPYGAAPLWETGLQKYFQGNPDLVRHEINKNHRVVRVELLKEKEDVCDLTVSGTHNFALGAGVFVHNSVDGDSAAAMRYTEAKMSRISGELLRDLEKETVLWRPNYDGTKKEPTVLPSALPNLLLNGTLGIAVGMATNIPPHNAKELIDATIYLIDNKDATAEDLLQFVPGPDFPTGGIVFNSKDIAHAYASGRGGVLVRGEAEILEGKSGASQIIISSLPYRVNKAELVARTAELVKEKKIEGIRALRDESARGEMRIAIDLKSGTQPQKVLNLLYKYTDLSTMFHFNMLALVDGVPQTLSLKGILQEFISHRRIIIRRRTEFDLKKALEREHILFGLKKALDAIDKVIKTIKQSKDTPTAHTNLKKEFGFSDVQATAILEMKLQKLAGLERKNIEDELLAKRKLIKELKELLASEKEILRVVKSELHDVGIRYGDPRKTRVVKGGVRELSDEDLVPEEQSILVLTRGGYIKRTNPNEYRQQKRGGVGVVDLDTKDEDFVTKFLTASTHESILFFSNRGRVYQSKMYEIPEGRRATKGKSIMNFLPFSDDEFVTSVLAIPKKASGKKGLSLVMVTSHGMIKKVSAESFFDVRRNGIIAMKLKSGDTLLSSSLAEEGDDVVLVTAKGQAIRFKESKLRAMGRGAGGVRAIRLKKGDSVMSADIVGKDFKNPTLLVMGTYGYGKKTPLKEYKVQGRGGSGIKTARVTAKTGDLIVAKVITEEMSEIIAISKQSQVIRVLLKEIPSSGRQTQGVRIMRLRPGDSVATFVCQ